MKKTITITLITALISCIFLSIPVSATTADNTERTIEYLYNGDYIETIITDDTANPSISLYTTNTITKTKTRYYKNSSGTVLWSVAIKATFSYNGSTSTCTSCSHSTTAPGASWSIKVHHTANLATQQQQKQQLPTQYLEKQQIIQCQLQ